MTLQLPIPDILAGAGDPPPGEVIGTSRDGRAITAHRLGAGELRVSLIGGCHADEPVGPATLRRLVTHLAALPAADPLLTRLTWLVVPHVNPDGEALNARWTGRILPLGEPAGAAGEGYDPAAYVRHAVREMPGDDVEFGFPRDAEDHRARPENRAVVAFLDAQGPLHLHGSFHGMGFASGPWFLVEPAWIERTEGLREHLRQAVRQLGYHPYDVDRRGEKGFQRIDPGFATRPDSAAMRTFFLRRREREMACRFRPSSMEHVRSLGGDPFTLVPEMPLFLVPEPVGDERPEFPSPIGAEGRLRFQAWLGRLLRDLDGAEALAAAAAHGIRPMPIRDQMHLQLAFLDESLRLVDRAARPRR